MHDKMKRRTWIFFIIIAGFCTGCIATRQKNDPFFFVQMTDTQFGFFNDNKSFEKETVHFEQAVKEVNRLKPAFVIITGDLVNRPFDSAQVAEYKRVSKGISARIPLYNVAGNHDVGNTPSAENITTYNNEFGADYYTFSHRGMLGIVLNSLYLHSPEKVPGKALEQEKWLVNILKEAGNRYEHKVVFLHHPLFLNHAGEENGYFNIPRETRKKYLEIFEANGVKYIFAGHYHRNSFGKSGAIEMVTTGPVGKPLGKDSSGFRIITVKGKNIFHRYHNLDAVPSRKEILEQGE